MIRCVAVDDEPLALKQMENYIEKTPYLDLLKTFENALLVIPFLEENDVDLLFLDINMPDISGLDFFKSLNNPPAVIFTTAYSEYAVEGFKVDAVDYLLKPVSYGDFLKGAEKAKKRIASNKTEVTEVKADASFLFIKSDYKILRINLSEIKYIESMREYLRIHIENQAPVMTLMRMKNIEKFLPEKDFMRVHRSFIVHLNKISAIERNRIIFDKKVHIPVSEQYKEKFNTFLENNFLT